MCTLATTIAWESYRNYAVYGGVCVRGQPFGPSWAKPNAQHSQTRELTWTLVPRVSAHPILAGCWSGAVFTVDRKTIGRRRQSGGQGHRNGGFSLSCMAVVGEGGGQVFSFRYRGLRAWFPCPSNSNLRIVQFRSSATR